MKPEMEFNWPEMASALSAAMEHGTTCA